MRVSPLPLVTGSGDATTTNIVLQQDRLVQAPATSLGLQPLLSASTAAATRDILSAFGVIRVQAFTASGTYTPNADMLYCIIEAVGGGGSGGSVDGTAGQYTTGSGGGGGSYSRKIATIATIGASQTVTIGAGGTAPASGAVNGNAGGDTSVGSLCIGKGGSGGPKAQVGVNVTFGGAGGVAGTGDVTIPGGDGGGGVGNAAGSAFIFCGWGGASLFSGECTPPLGANGNAGKNYGGGGTGAQSLDATNFAGGAGAAGYVLITEFCSQ